MEIQNQSLETQIKTSNERRPNITPSGDQAFLVQRNIHRVQLKLAGKIYKIKQAEMSLNEISVVLIDFRTWLLKVKKKD